MWDKMTKKKLGTFKTANAITEFQKGDKVVKIKEERELLQRSRPELNLKVWIGKYEFGVVPRSLFASDGFLLLAYDKEKYFILRIWTVANNRFKLTEMRQLEMNHLITKQSNNHLSWQKQ